MIPKLMVVLAVGRGGSSLVCDLVASCGYSLGINEKKHNDPRHGRNEFPGIGVEMKNPTKETRAVVNRIELSGTTVVKVGYNYDYFMTCFKDKVIDLRTLVVQRNITDICRSRVAYGMNLLHCIDSFVQSQLNTCSLYLASPKYNTLRVNFELLLQHDRLLLANIIDFIDGDATPDELVTLIHPEIVIHTSSKIEE